MAFEPEHHQFTWVPPTLKVHLTASGMPLLGAEVRALNMKGMIVFTESRLNLGTPCEAVLSQKDWEGQIRTTGTVVSFHANGFRVEFLTIDSLESYINLRNLILPNLGDLKKAGEDLKAFQERKARALLRLDEYTLAQALARPLLRPRGKGGIGLLQRGNA